MRRRPANPRAPFVLLGVVAVSLLLVWTFPYFDRDLPPQTFQRWTGALAVAPQHPDPAFIQAQALTLASSVYPDAARAQAFADELAAAYSRLEGVDVLLVYNPGGLGGAPMSEDPEWPSILYGISDYLQDKHGLSSAIMEHMRASYGGAGYLAALGEMQSKYPQAAPVLAAKLAFLTRYHPALRVIVTGRSHGAIFTNEVVELLLDNDRVYSIQAGRSPDYGRSQESPRHLLLPGNGASPDPLSERDWWSIIKANVGRIPPTMPPEEGSMQVFKWYLRAPGHAYTWDIPELREQIVGFLDAEFTS